jgi:hypothetical protein
VGEITKNPERTGDRPSTDVEPASRHYLLFPPPKTAQKKDKLKYLVTPMFFSAVQLKTWIIFLDLK